MSSFLPSFGASNPAEQPAPTEQPVLPSQQLEPADQSPAPGQAADGGTPSTGVGDLVTYTVADGVVPDVEHTRYGVVLELLEEPELDDKGKEIGTRQVARVVELPAAGVLELDRLSRL